MIALLLLVLSVVCVYYVFHVSVDVMPLHHTCVSYQAYIIRNKYVSVCRDSRAPVVERRDTRILDT